MRHYRIGYLLLLVSFLTFTSVAAETENIFHQLIENKSKMETSVGIEELECYPYISNIGFTEDQKLLIRKCKNTVVTLGQALQEIPKQSLRIVGISDRFQKMGGFDTVLVKAGASKQEIQQFLGNPLSQKEQQEFLNRVNTFKKKIRGKVIVTDLYCTLRISNDECLKGYQTLAAVLDNTLLKKKRWAEMVVTDSFVPLKNPDAFPIKFDGTLNQVRDALVFQDAGSAWEKREALYETLEERYGGWFKSNLNLAKLLCAVNLTGDECLQGASNFYLAGPRLTQKHWNKVVIDKYNTLIKDDFDAHIRYDMKPDAIVDYFSNKPDKKETLSNQNLADKLERRTKNNPSRLRVVCDLEGLRSQLCVRGFKHFFKFMKETERLFKAFPEKTALMFVDGNQLARVNFALNSKTRKDYIYMDANSEYETFKKHISRFGKISEEEDF